MIDLPIGVKFYFDDMLVVVAEDMKEEEYLCIDCVFNCIEDFPCEMFECSKITRKDKTDIIFKKVKNG